MHPRGRAGGEKEPAEQAPRASGFTGDPTGDRLAVRLRPSAVVDQVPVLVSVGSEVTLSAPAPPSTLRSETPSWALMTSLPSPPTIQSEPSPPVSRSSPPSPSRVSPPLPRSEERRVGKECRNPQAPTDQRDTRKKSMSVVHSG